MFLKKRDHAMIMARLRAEVGDLSTKEAEAHFTIKFDERNEPILSQVTIFFYRV